MRTQDEKKKEAIFVATIKLVNEVGFAAASVAKIAKEANVSPATLYIYHKNKEDLLCSIYTQISEKKSAIAMNGFAASASLKETLRKLWHNSFKFVSENQDLLQYHDQFLNSPYSDLLDDANDQDDFQPVMAAIETAAKEKVIKPVDVQLIKAFIFSPLVALANPRTSGHVKITRKKSDDAFEMAWDAIKLE